MEITYINQKKITCVKAWRHADFVAGFEDTHMISSSLMCCLCTGNENVRHGRKKKLVIRIEKLPHYAPQASDSSGVYICKSIVNNLRHENYICKSEEIYLVDSFKSTQVIDTDGS